MPDDPGHPPGVGGKNEPWLTPEADAFRAEVKDFGDRLAAYIATADPPFDSQAAATEAVRLVFEDAFFETYPLVKRRMEMFGRD